MVKIVGFFVLCYTKDSLGHGRLVMEEITIAVDDHPLFQQGVINTFPLEPGIKIVGQASNGADALSMIRTLHPYIAVVDFI